MINLKIISRLAKWLYLPQFFDPWYEVKLNLVKHQFEIVVELHVDTRLLLVFATCPIEGKHAWCLPMLLIYDIRTIRLRNLPSIIVLHVSNIYYAFGRILTLEGLEALWAVVANRVVWGKDWSLDLVLNDHWTLQSLFVKNFVWLVVFHIG